ncbi:DUF2628 domain-containing protein [Acidisoma cladoniae]|jgi:hypothetical protein|uniref:DUF2628 domain-containing protein n=1 Tax=Acidisoma cladoniae TaxID=3040935 RepID=UPI00254A0461|nr:DUF2628 domain-containing protein [Acidisoma sp. PAMC 29798]
MRIYTAHTRPDRAPRLVREGFSLGAFLFGPIWLLAHRAWLAAVLDIAAIVVLLALGRALPGSAIPAVLMLGLAALTGWNGRDLCRWSLSRRGFTTSYVIAARNADAAFARLLTRDPALIPQAAGR